MTNNIVLFGESGSGKSSIVNMLSSNEHTAEISSGAKGCTFQSKGYEVDVLGLSVTLWDTAGLDEGDAGRVPKPDAIVQLYKLVRNLTAGVNLLMFVMRAPRIKDAAPKNWKLFHEVICRKEVPIVIAVTGLEQEENMDCWWWDNKGAFQKYGIFPSGFACITASRGKALKKGGHAFDEEFEESQRKIRELIRSTCLDTPWRVPPAEWFKDIVVTTYRTRFLGLCPPEEINETQEVTGEAFQQLIDVCGMSEKDAKELVDKMKGT